AGVETQEYTYLSFEARQRLIRSTIDYVDGRVPVMVGITHASFRTAIALAHEAEKCGAAALQLLAPLRPFAGPPTQRDLLGYFEKISSETSLPLTLYLNPGPGADVSIPDTIALAKLPRVQFIKESSRDLARVSRLIVEIARAVIEAFVAKDYERAAQIQLQFAQFPSRWMHYGLAPSMKAAMNLIGVPA